MKVAIVGSRNFNNYDLVEETLNHLLVDPFLECIISGGAIGADKLGEKFADENNIKDRMRCLILINGESIGQVASQTLPSINVVSRTVNIPIVRPLATYDKLDIIKISKKIDCIGNNVA